MLIIVGAVRKTSSLCSSIVYIIVDEYYRYKSIALERMRYLRDNYGWKIKYEFDTRYIYISINLIYYEETFIVDRGG